MISFVVPVYNEEESIQFFYEELKKEIKKNGIDYELIFVDDGSFDSTLSLLKELHTKDKKIKIISFRKNQGKAEALTIGFHTAKGERIVTLDADLQDKPSEIGKLLAKINEGYDLVCGWRKNRQDVFKKKISSKLFNFLVKIFWGLELHDYNCGLKVYTKDAAQTLHLYGGQHRFIPLIISQFGFRITEVAIEHDVRKFGKSKFGFSKIWKDIPDLFTMLFLSKYSTRPLHFFGFVGILFVSLGIIILIYLTIIHFQGEPIGRRPLLFLGILLVLSGLQTFFTGFIGELIINSKNYKKDTMVGYQTEE